MKLTQSKWSCQKHFVIFCLVAIMHSCRWVDEFCLRFADFWCPNLSPRQVSLCLKSATDAPFIAPDVLAIFQVNPCSVYSSTWFFSNIDWPKTSSIFQRFPNQLPGPLKRKTYWGHHVKIWYKIKTQWFHLDVFVIAITVLGRQAWHVST